MRGTRSAVFACILSLPSLALGAPPPASAPTTPARGPGTPPGGEKATAGPITTVTELATTPSTSLTPLTTSRTQSYPTVPPISLVTITVLSSMASASVQYPADTSTAATSTSSSVDPGQQVYSTSLSSSTSSSSVNATPSYANRNLVIILSSILGFIGLLLIIGLIILLLRYRRQIAPFGQRGVTPIDDEEIASWRRREPEKEPEDRASDHRAAVRVVPELPLSHHQPWTWATTASSGSIHTIPSPESPSQFVTAPNARAGLTDETIPGADPFITPLKRQNLRLSKLPPGHSRTRSGRSSFSAKSMLGSQGHNRVSSDLQSKGSPGWYDFDDHYDGHAPYLKEIDGLNSPKASTFDDMTSGGGLSPRPQAVTRMSTRERADDIGRAIA